MKYLMIAAHPDDEVLGCGGTIARLSHEGHRIFVVILGEGLTSRDDIRTKTKNIHIKELQNQSRRAAAIIGAEDIFFNEIPDNRFDTVPLLEIIQPIEKLIQKLSPEVIYTHHPGDLNIDHYMTFRAVLTATRPFPEVSIKKLYTFEIPSSSEWSFSKIAPNFCPNSYVNITNTLPLKIKALEQYQSEIREFPHPRSKKTLESLAYLRGSAIGVDAAEAFELVRGILY